MSILYPINRPTNVPSTFLSSSSSSAEPRLLDSTSPPHIPLPHLAEVLQLCNIDWVRKFLFTSDPIHIHKLNDPVFTSQCLTGTLTISRFLRHPDAPDARPGQQFQHLLDNLLVVQDFAADGIAVGYGIKESAVEDGVSWLPSTPCPPFASTASSTSLTSSATSSPSTFFNFRFALAPSRSIALFVYDAPCEDAVILRCSIFRSASLVHMFKVVLSRNSFQSLMRSNSDLSPSLIQPMVRVFQDERQARPCVTCALSRSEAAKYCRCTLPIPRQSHPHDVVYFTKVMGLHVGDFAGVAHSNGRELLSFLQVKGMIDVGAVARLRDWGLRTFAMRTTRPDAHFSNMIVEAPSRAQLAGYALASWTDDKVGGLDIVEDDNGDVPEPEWALFALARPRESEAETDEIPEAVRERERAREAAMERRRERNRKSAARSNLKKKEEKMRLQTELVITKRRKEELLNKQRELIREQNMLLRMRDSRKLGVSSSKS